MTTVLAIDTSTSRTSVALIAGDKVLFNEFHEDPLAHGEVLPLLVAKALKLNVGVGSVFGVENITSPTFVISRIHKGNPNFIHIDAYRLLDAGVTAFADLDFESYLSNSVFVIEWGKDFVTQLSDQYLDIKISSTENESERVLEISGEGDRWVGFKV